MRRIKDKPPVIEEERATDKTESEQFDRIYEMSGLPLAGAKYTATKLASLIQSSKYPPGTRMPDRVEKRASGVRQIRLLTRAVLNGHH